MPSYFIAIEGIDGAGTTTQTELLAGRLVSEDKPAIQTCEPSNGPIGMLIRQALARRVVLPARDGLPSEPLTRETLAALFAADRLDHVATTIAPHLAKGSHVICDRYLHSSLAYQGDIEEESMPTGLLEGEQGLGYERSEPERVDYSWILSLNSRALTPDLTVFLRVDLETSLSRLSQRGDQRDLYETRAKLERLIRRYEEVMQLCEDRGDRVLTLDAKGSITTIHEQIFDAVEALP